MIGVIGVTFGGDPGPPVFGDSVGGFGSGFTKIVIGGDFETGGSGEIVGEKVLVRSMQSSGRGGLTVALCVGSGEEVAGTVGVGVGVGVADSVGVGVGVGVADSVGVGVGVGVADSDGVGVGVGVGVADSDGVGVGVGVRVGVGVGED